MLQVLLVQAFSEVVMPRRMSERRRKMSASEGLRNFVGFAKDIFGVGEGAYELRNHDGMGFCWGFATLATRLAGRDEKATGQCAHVIWRTALLTTNRLIAEGRGL